MAAKRCSRCNINWPPHQLFEECPSCCQNTWESQDLSCIPYPEAHSLRKHYEFERYYEQRGEKPLDGRHIDLEQHERVLRTADEIIALYAIPVDGEPLPVERLAPEHFGRDRHVLRGTG